MKKLLVFSVTLMVVAWSCKEKEIESKTAVETEAAKEIHFFTSDSIKVYGDLYEQDQSAPTLLIFHQGGSNTRAEYKSIIPILEKDGFNILAIDQRV